MKSEQLQDCTSSTLELTVLFHNHENRNGQCFALFFIGQWIVVQFTKALTRYDVVNLLHGRYFTAWSMMFETFPKNHLSQKWNHLWNHDRFGYVQCIPEHNQNSYTHLYVGAWSWSCVIISAGIGRRTKSPLSQFNSSPVLRPNTWHHLEGCQKDQEQ